MSIKLIYHTEESINGGLSPFDKIIHEISKNDPIFITCPYLGVYYIERLLDGRKDWKIISDLVEWIKSTNGESRSQTIEFISKNLNNIRNYPNLHSKVIISGNNALVGSANFTKMGISKRIEMAVLFENENQVRELHTWFNNLWRASDEININEIQTISNKLPNDSLHNIKDKILLKSNAPKIRARLLNNKKSKVKIDQDNLKIFNEDEIFNIIIKRNKIIDKEKAYKVFNHVKFNIPIELRDKTTYRTNKARSQISFIIQNYLIFRMPYTGSKFRHQKKNSVYLIYPISDIDNLNKIIPPDRLDYLKKQVSPFAYFDCILPMFNFDEILRFDLVNWNSFQKGCFMAKNARKSRKWDTNIYINWGAEDNHQRTVG